MDEIVPGNAELNRSGGGHNYILLVMDNATHWTSAYPLSSKSADEITISLAQFLSEGERVKRTHTDVAAELDKAIKNVGWSHGHTHSTPGNPRSNGRIERRIKTVVDRVDVPAQPLRQERGLLR